MGKKTVLKLEITSFECGSCGAKHNTTPKPQKCKNCGTNFIGFI